MHYTESKITKIFGNTFDYAEKKWHSHSFARWLASALILTFLLTLVLIELKNAGMIHWEIIPANHFKAIELAFTLLLFFEVISMVFSLVHSVSKSVEIQLQILSLILLRNAFKLFGSFPNDYQISLMQEKIMYMFADAFGALILFGIIILIRRLDKHRGICASVDMQKSFISVKKIIGLILLVVFGVMIVMDVYYFFMEIEPLNFFRIFFTFMIFTDILLVFISLRYSNAYQILFRNSGFALATIIMRLAFEAPAPFNDILGVGAAVFVLCLIVVYNQISTKAELAK
ncbi:MAG: hypothetical protein JXR71_00320 [Bacteroidales bacterium]|nr:hypothetical protein [Bacteroidales bacterium]